MDYSIFPRKANDATQEPMFFGNPINVARYEKQKYPIFDKLYEQQTAQFWRPEEVDVSRDRIDFSKMSAAEQHIFTSNLRYQTLLDSIQGRSPSLAFMPLTSLPEIEAFIDAWVYFEGIHSRSYTHIIRNIYNNPTEVLDGIMLDDKILKRAEQIGKYYDDLIEYGMRYTLGEQVDMKELKKKLLLCMVCVNVLEAVRFYVSFACSFSFAERELMEGNAKIIKLVARDEAIHLSFTQNVLGIWRSGADDVEMKTLYEECMPEIEDIFRTAVEQEKEWADYLFKDGSMIGLNADILKKYVEFISNQRAKVIGLPILYPNALSNPIPWVNNWLTSDNVQVAPQEVEISSYLIGQIDSELNTADLESFEL